MQLLTLSAKLLVLAHLAPLTPHLRTLSLLFTYLTTLARYDLTYEVRDRARFLKGLLAAAGVGQGQAIAKMGLGEEEFRRGVQVEEYDGGASTAGESETEERSLTSEQVRKVLFEGKSMEDGAGGPSLRRKGASADLFRSTERSIAAGELGTFSLALPSKRLLFSSGGAAPSTLPPYPSTVPPPSIRDAAVSTSPTTTRSPTPLRGFGSDSLRGSSGRASPVVLVPTNFSGAEASSRSASPASFGGAGRKSGFVDLEDFYADEVSDEEEESGEEESGSEEDEDEESGEEESGSGEAESDEEADEKADAQAERTRG